MEHGYVPVREIEKLCKTDIRTEWVIEYLEQITEQYINLTGIIPSLIVRVRGHHKTKEQKNCDKLIEYTDKLKKYAEHIRISGEERNTYSKTDTDAPFMRKKDYMGNDQLPLGYNIQIGLCDEYISVFDVK